MTPANPIVWFELPATDLERATRFYEAVFQTHLKQEATACGFAQMAVFDQPEAQVKGCLIQGDGFVPATDGAIVYLHGGADLAEPLARVVEEGGAVLHPKTAIGPWGFVAWFRDSEGNRVGLHSMA